MVYRVKFADGCYLQMRGGNDWGRSDHRSGATTWPMRAEASMWARMTGGRVVRGW